MKITIRHICIILFTAGILLLVADLLYIREKNREISKLEENFRLVDGYLYLAEASAADLDSPQMTTGYEDPVSSDKIKQLAEEKIYMYRKIYDIPDSLDHYAAVLQVKSHIAKEILSLNEDRLIFMGRTGQIMDYIILIFPPAVMLVWLYDLVFRKRKYR